MAGNTGPSLPGTGAEGLGGEVRGNAAVSLASASVGHVLLGWKWVRKGGYNTVVFQKPQASDIHQLWQVLNLKPGGVESPGE